MTGLLLAILAAMAVSFFCSLLEACVLSLSLPDIARLFKKRPATAKLWIHFKQNVHKPIAAIIVMNTFAHTIGASFSGSEFTRQFGPKWVFLFSLAFSYAMIQWTELLPKSLGTRYNRAIAVWIVRPLHVLLIVVGPLVRLMEWLNRPFVGRRQVKVVMNPVDDITVLSRYALLNNMIGKQQADILTRTVNLSKLRVRDIMVGRDEIRYLTTSMSLADALVYAHIHRHTRLPLADGQTVDAIMGYVNFKDIVSILRVNPHDTSLRGICRPIITLSPEDPVTVALRRLASSHQHIAVVRETPHRVCGIVTLEDVVEAIVGDMGDEYDILPVHVQRITPTRTLVGAGLSLLSVQQHLPGIPLPTEARSLNDWLVKRLGRVPRVEEVVEHEGWRFIVHKVRRSAVHEVVVEQPKET